MEHNEKIVDGITIKYLCQPCPGCKAKLEAAEEMARALTRLIEWWNQPPTGPGMDRKRKEQYQAISIQLSGSLSAWEKAGKEEP